MIKTLRITSILAVIIAVIVLIFPVVFGARSNPSKAKIEQILNEPGAIEKFNKAKTDKATKDRDQSSPLVKQAQALALYLNPPQPKAAAQRKGTPSPIGSVSAKFPLLGTSFYAARPELSLALIDEPGKGPRWVRQSSKVGHLTIEQIKDGVIVIRDGQRTYELQAEEKTIESTPPKASQSKFPQRATPKAVSTLESQNGALMNKAATPKSKAERQAALEELVEKLKSMQSEIKSKESDSGISPKEKAELMGKIISEFKESRISLEEAKKLGDLGEELNSIEELSSKAKNKKVIKPIDSNQPKK